MTAVLGLSFNQTILDIIILNSLYAYSAYYGLMGGGFVLLFAGFIGLGAYTYTIVITRVTPSVAVGLVVAVVLCVCIGAIVILPLRRLSGVYLGIVSLVFVALLQTVESGWQSLTGGSAGLILPINERIGTDLLIVFVLLVIGVTALTGRSRLGLGIRARRHDLILTQTLGINAGRMWYVLELASVGLAGLAGGLSAGWFGYISPSSYSFNLIVVTVAMVMLGGSDHWAGPLIGTVILTSLTQEFQTLANWSYVLWEGCFSSSF